MIPFCRTPEEADRVLAVMAENGLRRNENGLQVYWVSIVTRSGLHTCSTSGDRPSSA